MKRKFLLALLSISMMIACTIGLAACDFGGGHSHDMAYHSAVDATCTEDGNIEYWYCDGCGKYFSDEEGKHEVTDITVTAKGHTWGDWEVTQEATCQEKGFKTRTCSVCNETESEETPLAEHSYSEWQVTEKATCTEEGEQKRTCEVCGHEETQTLPALGHTWGDWQIVEEATCKDGLRKHVCETCGAEEEEIIPASGEHKYIDTVIPPTVDEPGYTLHKCEICGEEYKDTYVDITFTEGLAYQLSADKEYYILTGIGDAIDTYLYLPASVNNKPVKEIAAKAFKDNTEITGVYIGSGVEVIGASAFNGCTSLKDITLFDSIKEIGVGAFEDAAYYNNRDNWENSALYIGSCLIDVRETALGTLDIKDCTHIIGAAAVADCVNILEVNIPDTVRYINRQAFAGCNTLEEVTVPSNVETMGVNAFYGCTSLKKLTIPFIGKTAEDTTSPFGYLFGTVNDMTNFEAVPQSLTEVIVTGGETVADSAFYGLEKLTKIVLPETIKTIGNQAFSGCGSLVDFVIPANVESIGTEAFKDCAALTSVAVPENVTSIGLGAFGGCSKLESITMPFVGQNLDGTGETHFGYIFGAQSYSDNKNTVPESLKKVEITKAESIGNYAFSGCSGITSIVIPDSVTRIGSSAFSNCVSLTSITIPASVTRIGEEVFYNCRSLTSITIPEGVTNVGKRAFINCISLTSITIPDSVVSIEIDVFEFCSSIESIYFQGDITDWLNIDFEGSNSNPLFNGAKLYLNNELVTELIIPDGVTEIKPHAFEGCNSLTSVTIPSSVTSIGDSAFRECFSLTEIIYGAISADDLTFESEVFYHAGSKSNGVNVLFCKGVKKIPNYLFFVESSSYTPKITSVTIGNDVTSIGNYAFYNCKLLESIIIPEGVASVGDSAFSGCSSLTNIAIPDSVTSIGDFAFRDCSNLVEIIYNAVALDVLSSESDVFYNAGSESNGINVLFGENVVKIPNYLFYSHSSRTPKIISVTISDSVTSIGDSAFSGCISITSVTIGKGVTNIGRSAFADCTGLTEINYNATSIDRFPFDRTAYFSSGAVFKNAGTTGDGVHVVIGENVEIIPSDFFNVKSDEVSPKIISVSIGNNVTRIGYTAFNGCSFLTSIMIPNSVKMIEGYAFQRCTSLTSLILPESVQLYEGVFNLCDAIETAIIPANAISSIPQYSLKIVVIIGGESIKEKAFFNCDSLMSISISDSVESIGEYAFYGCSTLINIIIPESMTSIGDYAFRDCSSLETVYYGGTVELWNGISIGTYNENLTNATLYYYSESQPTEDGNFWHYGPDGVTPVIWTKETT